MPYCKQEALLESHGFGATSLRARAFFDAVCILTSGTCPDAWDPRSYARTSNVGDNNFRVMIGGFALTCGIQVLHKEYHYFSSLYGVVPFVSAEVPRN